MTLGATALAEAPLAGAYDGTFGADDRSPLYLAVGEAEVVASLRLSVGNPEAIPALRLTVGAPEVL